MSRATPLRAKRSVASAGSRHCRLSYRERGRLCATSARILAWVSLHRHQHPFGARAPRRRAGPRAALSLLVGAP